MFDSLKAWLESIGDDSSLFRNADDEALHSALASLLYHFISLEGRHSGREKREFDRLMKREFGLGQEQVDHLYQAAKSSAGDPESDLKTVGAGLRNDPAARLLFLEKLLQLIDIHGTHREELELFYETVHEVFPELKETGARDDY